MEPLYSVSDTIITDLNDDCLLEVFQRLELIDLLGAADVCCRFRQIAQRQFALPKFKNDVLEIDWSFPWAYRLLFLRPRPTRSIDKAREIKIEEKTLNYLVLYVSKLLRIFGASVKSIKLDGMFHAKEDKLATHIYRRVILGLIIRYCSGTLSELELIDCDLTGETEIIMRPLLAHLQKLTIKGCEYSKLFGQMLSLWSPGLRELYLSYELRGYPLISLEMELEDILRQSFPKLTMISFGSITGENIYDIEEFLKLNPQLKKIGVVNCPSINGNFIRSIAMHVPRVETIEIDRIFKLNDTVLKYCGKLNCLSTLKLCTYDNENRSILIDQTFMTTILHEMHVAKIALQHLHVKRCGAQEFERTEQLVDAISEFKGLKTLWLIRLKLKMSHILRICEQLRELLELKLVCNEIVMPADGLLQMIKYAQKLQSLYYFEIAGVFRENKLRTKMERLEEAMRPGHEYDRFLMTLCPHPELPDSIRVLQGWRILLIDKRLKALYNAFVESLVPDEGPLCIDAYPKIAQIIGQRRENARLLIELDPSNPMAINIPKHLIEKYDDVLTLVCEKQTAIRREEISNFSLNEDSV